MSDPVSSELILAGYVPLTRNGFALPCFATNPRPNTWYTATCSVDGDHTGQITGFEVFESDDILRLAPELHRRVRIGSAWTDIFLWKQNAIVGTPQEIWNALEGERDAMLASVPLTGLDLALSIPNQDITRLVDSAIDFMRESFGAEKAQSWHSGILARQQLLIGLRRLAREAGLGREAVAAIGDLEIVPIDSDRLSVSVPSDIVKQFAMANLAEALVHRIRETTGKLGFVLAQAAAGSSSDMTDSLPSDSVSEGAIANAKEESDSAVRILILATEGRRARDVARHLAQLEWMPSWLAQSRMILEIEPIDQTAALRRIGGQTHEDEKQSSRRHDVVVLLFDEEHRPHALLSDLHHAVELRQGPEWTGVSLLAPALPEDMPSELLLGHTESKNGFDNFGFDAVIDTSVARSPFWTGNPRRALDRRIADVIVGAALLCSGKSPLRKPLKQGRGRKGTTLTFALSRDSSKQAPIRLASESTWPNLSREHGKLWSTWFTAKVNRLDIDLPVSGIVQIRDRRESFEDFALAVLTNVSGVLPENLIKQPLPARIRKELTWPRLGVGFRFGRTALKGIAICAETPTLAALRTAGSERWAILRYTDTESIKETTNLGSQLQLPYLPRQLRLPNIPRRPENRGLATRGIDPRDVVRLTNEEWKSWKSRLPRSLQAQVRRYRTSLSESDHNARIASDGLEFVLPRREVQEADRGEGLLRYVDRRDRRVQRSASSGKRLADLRVAWSKRAEGTSRFILADGVVPCEFAELERDEVPAQRFFIIDGDAAVPALLGSRIFAVWAKTTLTRSTSWMPRFSLSRTFETFPVPPPFYVKREGNGPSQLRITPRNARLRRLVEELLGAYRKRSIGALGELHQQIDRALLMGLKLDQDAPDFAIVELLLQPEYVYYQ
jgi:hypothetical protein